MKFRTSLALCVALLLVVGGRLAAAPPPKPNVLIILADDLGRGDYSAFGTRDIQTPNLDRLCREGMTFQNFILNSDNGGVLENGANNGPWRGGKQHMYEGGLRVPGIARWPGVIQPGSRTERMTMTMDIYPTVCEAVGVTPPPQIDGWSFLPALTGKDESSPKRDLYFVRREGGMWYGGQTIDAYRRDDWKLLQDNPFAPLELYELHTDPMESTNLATKDHRILEPLLRAMMKQIQLGGQVPWQPPYATPDPNLGRRQP